MKLLKKLGTRIVNDRKESFGIFWCNFCKKEVEKILSSGKRYKSCGCDKGKGQKNNYKHGGKGTRLYNIWKLMKQRILNYKNKGYKDYGGRGITVCNEWLEFIPFRDWALNNGYAENLQINRILNDGNYEPSNCNFVPAEENARNRRGQKIKNMEMANKIRELWKTGKYLQKELAEKYGVKPCTISDIIRNKSWKNN